MANKVALVTGGSRGIGRAICLEMARHGYDIAFTYFRNRRGADESEAAVKALGVRCLVARVHMGDIPKVRELVEAVGREYGRLDAIVNNAVSGVQRPFLEAEEKHWDWTMAVNVKAPWMLVQAALPLMREGGAVVNISSMGSRLVLSHYFAVGVSKAALEAMTRYMAVELAPRGIVVNAIAPWFVDTDSVRTLPNADALLADARARTPTGRVTTTEDVARVTAFLCSDAARMICGQTIVLDGGISLLGNLPAPEDA